MVIDKENKDTFNWKYTFRKSQDCKCKAVTVLQNCDYKEEGIAAEHSLDSKSAYKNNIYNITYNGKNSNDIAELAGQPSTNKEVDEKDVDSFEITYPLDLSNKGVEQNVLELIGYFQVLA